MDMVIFLLALGVGGVCVVAAGWRVTLGQPPSLPPTPQRRFHPSGACYANSTYRSPRKKWKDQETRNAALLAAGAVYDPMRNSQPHYRAVTMAYPNYQYSTCVSAQMGPQLILPTPKPPGMTASGPYGD